MIMLLCIVYLGVKKKFAKVQFLFHVRRNFIHSFTRLLGYLLFLSENAMKKDYRSLFQVSLLAVNRSHDDAANGQNRINIFFTPI